MRIKNKPMEAETNKNRMFIDVIIPTYQRYKILAETLESVLCQTYPNWECWIAEDGETEQTRHLIAPFLKDKRFHYLPGKHAGTPAVPRNRAMQAGKAPYIAFLDDDDIWLPDKLAQQVAFLNAHPSCVLLGCNALIMKDGQNKDHQNLPLYFQKAPFGLVAYKKLVQDDYFITSSAIIQRSVLKFSGLQNETLHKGPDGEDHDMWLRVGVLGEMWLMSSPLVIYREASSKNDSLPATALERRQKAYRTRFKIYQSALQGVGEMPSPLLFPEYDRQERSCRGEKQFYEAGPKFLGRLRHETISALADLLYRPTSKKKCEKKAMKAFLECKARWVNMDIPKTIESIVFSKDRALQLHGLLSTFRKKVHPVVQTHVLYMASTPEHQKAYDEVISIFKKQDVCFIQQTGRSTFRKQLLEILFSLNCDLLFFLVDDILFTETVHLEDLMKFNPNDYVPSLRLGRNIRRCYVLQCPQRQPDFLKDSADRHDKIVWQWKKGELDWGYPLSVDGHLYARREMAAMASLLSFEAPNSFEDQLQLFKPLFQDRQGIAYQKSKIVNVPCNRVQNERINLSGNTSSADLLKKWEQGYQIDGERIFGTVNESVHQEIYLPLILRNSDVQ